VHLYVFPSLAWGRVAKCLISISVILESVDLLKTSDLSELIAMKWSSFKIQVFLTSVIPKVPLPPFFTVSTFRLHISLSLHFVSTFHFSGTANAPQ